MNSKSTALFLFVLFLTCGLAAQATDVLQMRSGAVLTGEIIDYVPKDKIVFKRSSDGATQTFPMESIAKIQQLSADIDTNYDWWILIPEVEGRKAKTEIRLIDGTTHEGVISEYQDGGNVSLLLDSGSTITVVEDDITGVTYAIPDRDRAKADRQIRKHSPKPAPAPRPKPVYEFKENGWFQNTSFAFSFGRREREEVSFFGPGFEEGTVEMSAIGFNIQHIMGYQFNRLVGAGVGVSYDAYDLEDGESVLTFFGHYRAYLSKGIVAPFASLSAGYGFALLNEDQGVQQADGGWMIHPEIGLRLGATDKANFTIGLGYRLQDAYYVQERPFNGNIEYRNVIYQRFLFTLGLLF
ncbi:MAG: hypothetical protein AAFP77_17175 [Bacteroidota bacterium]